MSRSVGPFFMKEKHKEEGLNNKGQWMDTVNQFLQEHFRVKQFLWYVLQFDCCWDFGREMIVQAARETESCTVDLAQQLWAACWYLQEFLAVAPFLRTLTWTLKNWLFIVWLFFFAKFLFLFLCCHRSGTISPLFTCPLLWNSLPSSLWHPDAGWFL